MGRRPWRATTPRAGGEGARWIKMTEIAARAISGSLILPVLALRRADSRRAQAQLPGATSRDHGALAHPDRYADGDRARIGMVERVGADGGTPAAVPRPR